MGYKDEDIEFANRLLTRREELSDEEVMTWLKEKDHVELLDEIATNPAKIVRTELRRNCGGRIFTP